MAKINWTADAEKKLADRYAVLRAEGKANDVVVKTLATEFDRTNRQVQGKLVHLKIYTVDEKTPSLPKDEGPTKKDYLAELRNLNVTFDADGLAPCKKDVIAAVVDFVKAKQAA